MSYFKARTFFLLVVEEVKVAWSAGWLWCTASFFRDEDPVGGPKGGFSELGVSWAEWEGLRVLRSWQPGDLGPVIARNWILPAMWMRLEVYSVPEPPGQSITRPSLWFDVWVPEPWPQISPPWLWSYINYELINWWYFKPKFLAICYSNSSAPM